MKCKNCGKEIVVCSNRCYHKDSQKWYCSTLVAEPEDVNVLEGER